MKKNLVSVIIAGRTEKYFQNTIDSTLKAAKGDIEIVAIVDGDEVEPFIKSFDSRVKIIRLEKSIGQRAGYNLGVRESNGEYVMKIDAHCLLSDGFDLNLKSVCKDKDVVLPEMKRLNVHEWKCKLGGETLAMFFGLDMYCHYWPDYLKKIDKADTMEVMNGQGSCWFCKRDWNDYIGLLDERVGSWGNVGIEVALRTWLCGGRQTSTRTAWQAHWFRKDEGGFPYPMNGRNVAKAHKFTRENFYFNDKAFVNQERPFKWLIDKFSPPTWESYLSINDNIPRYVVYYTDSRLDETLANAVRKQLQLACGVIPIISVSKVPLNFGKNVCIGDIPHSYESMYKEVLAGLNEVPDGAIVFLAEHDVFYHPSHFAKTPEDKHNAWFNTARYYWATHNKFFYKARGNAALSQGVAYKEVWMKHVSDRLALWAAGKDTVMKIDFKNYESARPNVDVRHGDNLTPRGHYKKKQERGELEHIDNLPGWGRVDHFLKKVDYSFKDKGIIVDKQKVDVAVSIHNKWKSRMPQPSPIRTPKFTRIDLAGLLGRLGLVNGVEVGTRDGTFAEVLYKNIPNLKLSCVDPWDAYYHFDTEYGKKNYDIAVSKIVPLGAKLIKAISVEGVKEFEDNSLDFVYIDGDHRFDYVMEDLIAWGRKVKVGGVIAGHDYYRFRNAGVVPAVDVYTNCHYVNEWFITDEKEASFFWVKQSEPLR